MSITFLISSIGTCRISIFRLIANVTLIPESLPDSYLFPLLRIAYLGSQRVKSKDDVNFENEGEIFESIERNHEVFRSAFWVLLLSDAEKKKVPASSIIPNEAIIGPIALLRLLSLLSERGILNQIQTWTAIPPAYTTPGSTVHLKQIKQITDPATVKKLLTLALKRANTRRESGAGRLAENNEPDYARASYTSSAELYAALVRFLESPQADAGSKATLLDPAKKGLVMALGNAAEISNRFRDFEKGRKFAMGALEVGRGGVLEEALMTKNKRRLDFAKQELVSSSGSSH